MSCLIGESKGVAAKTTVTACVGGVGHLLLNDTPITSLFVIIYVQLLRVVLRAPATTLQQLASSNISVMSNGINKSN